MILNVSKCSTNRRVLARLHLLRRCKISAIAPVDINTTSLQQHPPIRRRNIREIILTNHVFRKFSTSSTTSIEVEDEDDDIIDVGPVTFQLQELISRGSIQPDIHQLHAAKALDRVYFDLMNIEPPPLQPLSATMSKTKPTQRTSFFGNLFGRATTAVADAATVSLGFDSPLQAIPGVYTYGGVGCGKTFLMDMLYHSIIQGPWSQDKQMVHYHKFMLNVHQFMHNSRKEQQQQGNNNNNAEFDLIGPVVHHILKQGRLLCLDEFQVTDVADAMILKELFQRLWNQGCVLITTSNRPPRDLYLHGLQRDRFIPFIDMLEKQCQVVSLMDNETDYRMMISVQDDELDVLAAAAAAQEDENNDEQHLSQTVSSTPAKSKQLFKQVYFFGKEQKKTIQKLFYEMTQGRPVNPTTLQTQGRKVKIPMACKSKSICMFSFEDLCQKALGAADYLVIGQQFSTVFLYGIPKLTVNELNWLRRLITFVDTMYELKVRLLIQTKVHSIDEIFVVDGDKQSYSQDEVFAFDRTKSRLNEMSSGKYLSSKWLGEGFGVDATVITSLDLQPSVDDMPGLTKSKSRENS